MYKGISESIISKTNEIMKINPNKKNIINEEAKNESNNEYNKLLDSKDFFFNYRNDEAFNKINILETKPMIINYNKDNYITFNPSLNKDDFIENNHEKIFIKNEFYYKNKYKTENINSYNDNINDKDKYYDLKNSMNSVDSVKMKKIVEEEKNIQNQIKYEEKLLKNLQNEKNKLIDEEKKRNEIILNEIQNNKNEINQKKIEIKKFLYESQEQKTEINNKNFYINSNENSKYYKNYLKRIRERNELINKRSNEMIHENINKEKSNYNLNIDNSYNNYKKIKTYNSFSNIPRKNSRKSETLKKINLNSYFQLTEKDKDIKFDSSTNYYKKNNIYSTPIGMYRTNKTDNSKENNNTNRLYKTLSLTQTRFYRSRINPEELFSHYAKEKVLAMNNNYKNKNIEINNHDIYLNYSSNIINDNITKNMRRLNTYRTNCFLEKRNINNKEYNISNYFKNNLCENCRKKNFLLNEKL